MKRAWHRIACAALIVAVAVSATSCAKNSGSSSSSASTGASSGASSKTAASSAAALKPITFTIYGGGTDPGTFPEDPVHQYIRTKLGVDVKNLYTANDPNTQLNLWLAAGDYPDAITQKAGTQVDNYVSGDAVMDLTSYYPKYLPRLNAMMKNNPRLFMLNIPNHNDKIWYIPCQVGDAKYPTIATMVGVRYDIWQKLGQNGGTMPKPKNLDEYYQMLKQMVQAAPSSSDGRKCYAISGWLADNWGGQWLVWGLTAFAGSYQWMGTAVASDSYQQKYCFDSDIWMYAMHFINNAYRDGIADPEAVTLNQEAYNQKLAQGLVYSTPYSGFWLDGVANTARASAGHPEQEIVPYTWMTYPSSVSDANPPITGGYDPTGIVKLLFTKNCKNTEEIIKRLSYLATDDGIALQGMGLEGVDWNYDANGFRQPTDAVIQGYLKDPDFYHKTGIDNWNIFSNYFGGCDSKGDAWRIGENKYVLAAKQTQTEKDYIQFLGLDPNLSVEANAAKAGGVNTDPLWYTTLDLGVTGTPLDDIKTQLNNMESEYIGKLYVAKTDAAFNSLIAEWKQKCEKLKYMDYYNHINPIIKAAYEKYKSSQGQ